MICLLHFMLPILYFDKVEYVHIGSPISKTVWIFSPTAIKGRLKESNMKFSS